MRVLEAPTGFQNRRARRLGRYYGLSVPSALLLGLAPETEPDCARCSYARSCPQEGFEYREMVRAVAEGSRLGIRLFLALGQGIERYRPELLDLALRNPDCTFLVFYGASLDHAALSGGAGETVVLGTPAAKTVVLGRPATETVTETLAAEAAAAGNLGFVLPAQPSQREGFGEGFAAAAAVMRKAGAPFGFVTGLGTEGIDQVCSESWLGGMLERGCLFGLFYPAAPSVEGGMLPSLKGEIERVKKGCPIPLLNLQEELIFTGERSGSAVAGAATRFGGRAPSPLLVHAVTPRFRSMTLLESIETASMMPVPVATAPVCPLLLDRGDTRAVLYSLLGR